MEAFSIKSNYFEVVLVLKLQITKQVK
ncbi:hypothetical protein VIBNIMADA3021_540064 [Vibrio nigripulchritudo MADA3021]|nr:hypothetical protein VIBNIMADA3021_540064 [Vibrio nigripulchritudo MADA3021]